MNRYRPKDDQAPGTGERPDPNHQYAYPINFTAVFEIHPQFALAMCDRLPDAWIPYTDPFLVAPAS